MSSDKTNTNNLLKELLFEYLSNVDFNNPELEVRFATRGKNIISRIQFDNVIKKLKSLGFYSNNENGVNTLKIQNEFIDKNTGQTKISNLRTEIQGLSNIQKYCQTNTLENIPDHSINFNFKSFIKKKNNQNLFPVNINDFNCRVSCQFEKNQVKTSRMVQEALGDWDNSKKIFRMMNRVSFIHDDFPIRFDLSIVKTNTRKGKNLIATYKFLESNCLINTESYEIEIEFNNDKVKNSSFNNIDALTKILKKNMKFVLSGLQNTNYPISYNEIDSVKIDYYKLINNNPTDIPFKVNSKDFCGPSSYTLELKNIQNSDQDNKTPSILNNYTVTDKADGDRKLLFINKLGKIYFITTNLDIEYTGTFVSNKNYFNSILDGEHILHNKSGEFINTFACFDIYYVNYKSVRDNMFVAPAGVESTTEDRLPLMNKFVEQLISDLKSVVKNDNILQLQTKNFYVATSSSNIFSACKMVLNKINEGYFNYNTDGLIFTPMEEAVGSTEIGTGSKPYKVTWKLSFKWKPAIFNTIDFLISINKKNNEDVIKNIFKSGINTQARNQIIQYKVLTLRCGYDEKKHGYINPCNNLISDQYPDNSNLDDSNSYKPVPFYPTNPYDEEAHICNMILRTDDNGKLQMMTEDNEVFEDNMIVEFRYDLSKKPGFRWIPIKVRYDKTAEFRKGLKNYGNAYHVANSNWHSIHNPVTEKMLMSGENIPIVQDDDVYYNKNNSKNQNRAMRDFHNLVIKKFLITGVAKKGDTLIDLAVGKGGDLSKWINAKLSFVFGIDISRDNIENRIDGACARYINTKRERKNILDALFVQGNSGLNIRNGDGIFTPKGKEITAAIFGNGPHNESILGKGVYKQFGKAKNGFDICSCQFAIHYLFKNIDMFNNLMKNISQCTKKGGYFIGTCYDGNKIFELLNNSKKGEGIAIYDNDVKIWEIIKEYSEAEFPNDVNSLGFEINVYQDTINKYFKEYLVNFEYFIRSMENIGFVPITDEEAIKFNLPSGINTFESVFRYIKNKANGDFSLRKQIGTALDMDTNQKQISFLNKYFIFKKIRNVDIDINPVNLNEDIELSAAPETKPKETAEIIVESLDIVNQPTSVSQPDASQPDASEPDASEPDASEPDASDTNEPPKPTKIKGKKIKKNKKKKLVISD